MRVLHLAPCGLALLAAASAQPRAQEAQRSVRPIQQDLVEPVSAHWSDLVELQASLPDTSSVQPVPSMALELPVNELPLAPRGGRVLSRENEPTPGIERIGPCAGFPSEPAIGLGMDSQLDVPDGAGFSYIPPDVAGGVGPRHLMTMLENQVLVTDRLGASPVAVDTSVFWSPLGATPLSPTHTYPRVVYDDLHGRWLASIRNGVTSTGLTVIFFAISATDDPTGAWFYYPIAADPTMATFADWLLLGYNSTWITFTANMFTVPAGASFAGAKMWVLDKASVLAGGPVTVSVFPAGFMGSVHPGAAGSSVHPARTLDGNPTQWLINNSFTAGGVWLLQLTQITGTGPSPVASGLAGSPFGGTTSFCYVSTNFSSTQRTMAQVGDARFISPFSVRTASVAVRNGKIWVAMSGGLPGPSTNGSPTSNGVIWHQLDPTLPFPGSPGAPGSMVLQSGAITNGANTMSMYPSIAVNCADDVLIGFANGDATIDPRACYTMRLGTAPLNAMGAINVLKAGESSYWKNFGVGTTAQYGRYTSTSVDPNDDKTLWTIQQYADTRVGPADNDSRWGTWWGRLGDCDELPEITDEPDPVAICVGDPASFSVTATSLSLPLSYQWRKDGVDISGANSSTYSIPLTVASDAGVYDCVVCGCGQVISVGATLSFNAPMITMQPVNQFAAVGGSASFSVAATGTGTLLYQWLHDNLPILGANSPTYSIASVTLADYGDYVCEVTDDCGPVLSSVAKLGPPKGGKFQPAELDLHIFGDPQSTVGCVDGSASFTVVAYPAGVTYSWRKNGTPIAPPETGPTLTIDPVTAGDAAFYDVIVSLGAQSVVSAPAALTVIDVPVITMQPGPASQIVGPGSDVTYSLTATGAEPLSYQWQRRPPSGSPVFLDIPGANGPTLLLEDVSGSDAGTYRCRVTNQCGSVRSNNCSLIVL